MIPINFNIHEAIEVLKPLAFFVLGMSVYAIFIFKFYRFLARKDIIPLNLNQYNRAEHPLLIKALSIFFYLIEYIVLFPIFTFFWFVVFVLLLSFMAKNQPLESILLVSIAVVGVIRVTAYYKEDLSKDLAKMLPFSLLGIFLVDISYFSFGEAFDIIKQIPQMQSILIYYLAFAIVLEFVLRIGSSIISIFSRKDEEIAIFEDEIENNPSLDENSEN